MNAFRTTETAPSRIEFLRPRNRLAGFYSRDLEQAGLPLDEVGELWLPRSHRISNHTNAGWELYLQVTGESTWRVGKSRYALGTGGYYLMPPRLKHELQSFETDTAHFFFVVFDPEKVLGTKSYLCDSWSQKPFFAHQGFTLEPFFRAIIREVCLDASLQAEALQAHLTAMCIEVTRLMREKPPEPHPALLCHPGAARAMELLQSRPQHPWKLDELAALSGLSPQHLIACFQRDLKISPMKFLFRTRLQRAARELLETDASVTSIAYDCGFSSSQHLAKAFSDHFQCSPRRYRAANASRSSSI
jgi:AraC-like DNA-binding protein